MIRRVRVFGLEVLSIETYDEPEERLTAGDNGGELRSKRIDVGLGFRQLPNGHWPDQEDE